MRKLYLAAALGFTLASFAACFPSLQAFEDATGSLGAGSDAPTGPGSGAGNGDGGSGAATSEGTGASAGANAGGSGGGATAPDGGPLDYCQLSTKQKPPEAIENPGLPAHTRCIDTTEVSFAQYQAFLDFAGDQYPEGNANKYKIGGINSDCSYKDGAPGGDHPYRPDDNNWHPYDGNRAGFGDRPVEGVDWCDAWAYCHFAGKELCGDASGVAIHRDDAGSWASNSEWYYACHQFEPWPTTPACYSAGTGGNDVANTLDVDSGCDGTGSTLEHMTSNVWEWENNCTKVAGDDRRLDDCRYRGDPNLSDTNPKTPSGCSWWNDQNQTSPRNAGGEGDHIGIRCCWHVHQPDSKKQ